MIYDKNWRQSTDRAYEIGCVLFLFSILLVFTAGESLSAWQRLLVFMGVNVVILIISNIIYRLQIGSVQKLYLVEIYDAVQIVQNVLNAKPLPFDMKETGEHVHFFLQSEDVELILKPTSPYARRMNLQRPNIATMVKIRSDDRSTKLLINSLRAKLDEAFSPKGL